MPRYGTRRRGVCSVVVLTMRVQGPAEPQQDVSLFLILQDPLSGGMHRADHSRAPYRFGDNFTVTRSPVVRSSLLALMPS